MLKIQEALLGGMSLAALTEKYAIIVRRHPAYNNLVLLKYDQLESPMGEPLVQECRGLILDEAESWRVISHPFNKFFNSGEGHAAVIDWSTACVQEKLDGSLCTLYWYDGKWNVATSGSPDAGGNVNDLPDLTFAKLFWKTFNEQGLKLPPHTDVDINFMFELMTPFNRIVVRHTDCSVKLIGARDRYYGHEYPTTSPRMIATGHPAVRSFALTSFEDIVASFSTIDPMSQEGYVVVDAQFNRNKVKHPGYVAMHQLRGEGNPTAKRMLALVQTGDHEEVLSYWPEWEPLFKEVSARISRLESELSHAYLQIEDFPSQKEFALEAVKTRCPGALFAMRAKKVSALRTYLANMNINTLHDLLKLDEVGADAFINGPTAITVPT